MSKELLKDEKAFPKLALGLVHYPIFDREKRIVATNITNFDIHDIARACTVYGVDRYFLIHPAQEQLMFVERILDHWRVGQGSKFNPFRKTALAQVSTAETLDQAVKSWGMDQCVKIATHARLVPGTQLYSCKKVKETLFVDNKPVFLLFGTGFGMTDEWMQQCDGVLESIQGAPPKDYRHLSVRSAVSIYLDRIMGPW